MSYRKEKKLLKKRLKLAERDWDEHPLSGSCKSRVNMLKWELKQLKLDKHKNVKSTVPLWPSTFEFGGLEGPIVKLFRED